jgi:hypothetical protein
MKFLNMLALLLVLVGALNWGLWGFFQFDLVAWVTGGNTNWMARFAYAVIGLAGVWGLGFLGKCKALCGCGCGCTGCKCCGTQKGQGGSCK